MTTRFRPFLLALAGVVLGASLSHAGGFMLGANLGMQSYTGDVNSGWDPVLVYGGSFDFLLNPKWAIGATLGYSATKHEDDGTQAAFPLSGTISNELTNLQFGVNAKFYPFRDWPLNPYVTAGIGRYGLKEEFSAGTYSETLESTEVGYRGGVGFQWMLTPMRFNSSRPIMVISAVSIP